MDAKLWQRIGWITVVVLFVLAAVLFEFDYQRYKSGTGATYGRATIGAVAPDVAFDTLDGRVRRMAAFAGHPLVINFFATWCVPCKAELALIESRYVRLAPRGLAVLGADQQESVAQVRAFVRAHSVTYPVVIDQGPALATYGSEAIPTSLFIDREGVLRAVHIGEMTPEMLDEELAKIM